MDLQQASLPCPSLSLRVYRNLYPLSRCCHPTISSSVTTFSSCPQSFPASGSFTVNQLFISRGQNIGASASVLPMNIQCRFPSGLTGLISLLSKRLSRIPVPQFESINSLALNLLYGPARTCIHDCWKKHSFASYRLIQTFVSKVISLFFSMLSRFVTEYFNYSNFNICSDISNNQISCESVSIAYFFS